MHGYLVSRSIYTIMQYKELARLPEIWLHLRNVGDKGEVQEIRMFLVHAALPLKQPVSLAHIRS